MHHIFLCGETICLKSNMQIVPETFYMGRIKYECRN
nr:MAG TPA: hypothetical protein [Caudoviricetes sp.]